MKKLILIAALLLPLAASAQLPWMKGKTPVPYQKDTTAKEAPQPSSPSFDTVPASLTITLDTTMLSASYHLQKAAKAQTLSFVSAIGGGVLAAIGLKVDSEYQPPVTEDGVVMAHQNPGTIFYLAAGAAGVLSLVAYLNSIGHTKDAGKALSRVHLNANGVSIDL